MTQIHFEQVSPRGRATIDSECLLVDTSGRVWVCSGAHGLAPLTAEQAKALHAHFGSAWVDALDSMTELGDG